MFQFAIGALAVPFLIALVVAVLVFLFEKYVKVGSEQRSDLYRAIYAFILTILLGFNLQTLYDVNRVLNRSSVDQIRNVKNSLDPDLLLIFGSHFDELIDGMRSLIEEREMRLSDIDQYRFFYRKFLAAYPDISFYATSLPREEYFWSPGSVRKNSVEEAIRDYVANGGRFERIFFTSGSNSPKARDERRIMDLHSQLGITVYYIDEADLPDKQRRCFLVASNGKIAAEALLGMNNTISELSITVDEERAEYFLRAFEKLKQHPKLQEYRGEGSL